MPAPISADYDKLTHALEGEFHTGRTVRLLYATDASEYQELPAAVALPRSEADVRQLLAFAREHGIGLIPRAAGTSLAGQVVGSGIVVDLGRHLDRILAIDPVRRRARVQPGVIYTTFHFPESGANVVTTENSDWATNCPEYKVTAVEVVKVDKPLDWQIRFRQNRDARLPSRHKAPAAV